jgi:DNA-binding transcriptional LysR family regulator
MGRITVGQQNSDAIEIYCEDPSSGQPVVLAETEPILLPGSEGVAPQGLELRHLRYFVAVADAGTFTYAAEKMFIAQPTLSQQIRRLEEMVGTPLLQRRREGVRLTAAGAVLLQESRTILSLLDHGVSCTRQAAGLGRPRLRVVMPPGLPEALAVETASRLRASAAAVGVDVAWLETPLDAEFSLIRHRRADAGLGWLAPAEEALAAPLDVMNLGEFEPDVWIPASHPAARRETISLGELARMDVIHGPPRGRAATYGAWLAVLRTIDPRFEFTDPPIRNSLPITLAFAATGSRPTAVLTCPCHAIGARKTAPPYRAADTCDMVPVGLDQSPLAATAGLVWNSDLPRPLQQVLFDTADAIIEPFSSWSLGTGTEAWPAAHHAGPLLQQISSGQPSPARP